MKRTYLITLFVFIFSVIYIQNSLHTLAEKNGILPANKEKHFISAKEFFLSGKLTGYSQFKEAEINIQQELLYKDLRQFIKSNVKDYYYINLVNIYSNPNKNVSPNRQVYFYCSILNNEKTIKYNYIIWDAESSKPIEKGRGYKSKEKD
ncbi:hypothetical protein M3685_23105 [Heyndrickxia oleronia]|uniref:hypothetical protein n=1 Tax=Heyndrickxia oleronia TaxID=38875 RepID=UPI00203A4C8B|nr:hypothetical protein [Heyndrickxia oleronia]MCM3456781.1 hypothetical protein [Heyndrickxia oleronia]